MTSPAYKRKFTRVPVDFPAHFSTSEKQFSGRIVNLSADGVLLRGSQLLDSGDKIHLSFQLASHQIRTDARIVWSGAIHDSSKTYGMGVRFENMPETQHSAIEQYLQNLLKA
jgi:uncharacterized protein (TIGR02266 family)